MPIPPALRPFCFAALAVAISAGLLALAVLALAPGGWSIWKLVILACFAGTVPWTGICAAHGLLGFLLLLLAGTPVGNALPSRAPLPRTAIALTVRNEDMGTVLPAMRRLLSGLDAAGVGDRFALFVLSDTEEPKAARLEALAVSAFRDADRDPSRIRYRRRAGNLGFKAGNIMDFLDHHADGFELMLTLDADSEMSAAAVLRLVRAMLADPQLGIVQHLIVGRPAASAFARLFQFGMRSGMRVWATGQAWWQADSGPYWGHNAMVRIAPFREHCRLERLPDGSAILSHDQIEAVRMRAAGWRVRILPVEDGSQEGNPPALPEFLRRDARWLAGNLQYLHLLASPGLTWMGRWLLLQAILLFAGAPLYALLPIVVAAGAALDASVQVESGPCFVLIAASIGALYAPKLLGYAEVLASTPKRARYGGSALLLAGAVLEFMFTLLLDAIAAVGKMLAMARLACGAQPGWTAQNRADRGVGWAEAARMFWPHSLWGLLAFATLAAASWTAVLWALPLIGGLLLAIPFCVITSDPRTGAWLQRCRLAAVPEEVELAYPTSPIAVEALPSER